MVRPTRSFHVGTAFQPRVWWRWVPGVSLPMGRCEPSSLTFAFLSQQYADVHDVISPGNCEKKRENFIAGKKKPFFGSKLIVVGTTSSATGHRGPAGCLVGSEVIGFINHNCMGCASLSSSEILYGALQLESKSLPLPSKPHCRGHKSLLSQWKLEQDPSGAKRQQLRPLNNSPTHRKLSHNGKSEFQGTLRSAYWVFLLLPQPHLVFHSIPCCSCLLTGDPSLSLSLIVVYCISYS